MATHLHKCNFVAASPGLADFVVGAVVAGHQAPAPAGAEDGVIYKYAALLGVEWEFGTGPWDEASNKIGRGTVTHSSAVANAKVSFTAPPTVIITDAVNVPRVTPTQHAADLAALQAQIAGAVADLQGQISGNANSLQTQVSATASLLNDLINTTAVETNPTATQLVTATAYLTIPVGAVAARVRLQGGGGGGYHNENLMVDYSAAAGGYLEKMLTGLEGGKTLHAVIGAKGNKNVPDNDNATAGGQSKLESGTQSIATLTANGGGRGAAAGHGTGGTASGGDINYTGQNGLVENGGLSIMLPIHGIGWGCGGHGTEDGIAGAMTIEWFTTWKSPLRIKALAAVGVAVASPQLGTPVPTTW